VSLPVPTTPFYANRTIYARWYVLDPSAANGFSVSQAIKFTIFGRNAPSFAGAAVGDD